MGRKRRSERLLDCNNPLGRAQIYYKRRGGKVTDGRLRPLSCANRKMILISEYQSTATNERGPAVCADCLYYLLTAAVSPAAHFLHEMWGVLLVIFKQQGS